MAKVDYDVNNMSLQLNTRGREEPYELTPPSSSRYRPTHEIERFSTDASPSRLNSRAASAALFRKTDAAQRVSQSYLGPKTPSPQKYAGVSVPDSSDNILTRIFDEDLSVNSPSRKKQLNLMKKQMTSTYEHDDRATRGNPDLENVKRFSNYHEDAVPFIQNQERLRKSIEYLRESEEFAGLDGANVEDRVLKFISCLSNPAKDLRLAGLLGLYEAQRTEHLSAGLQEIVLDEVLQSLSKWEEQDAEFIECALDVVGNMGPHTLSLDNLPLLISMVVHDETSEMEGIHTAAYSCLTRLGRKGLEALVKVASKDFTYLQMWILDRLSLNNYVQKTVLVPCLVHSAQSSDSSTRTQAVAALNRMFSLVWEGGAMPVLLTQIQEGSVDRQLVACTLRAAGKIGEHTLIKLLKQSDNPKTRMAAASALCWRIPSRPRQLDIRVVHDSVLVEDSIPGSMVRYIGPCAPVPFVDDTEEAYLEVNSRDFLASLQRLVRQEDDEELKGIFPDQPPLPPGDAILDDMSGISTEAISALVYGLRDEFEGVRETSTYALGFIGLPEGADAVTALTKALADPAPQVRTMAAWALGRLGPAAWNAAPVLLNSLKDGYWKVRTAACIALSTTGQNIGKKAYPVLTKILKDGAINRITVAETIVKLGASGESLLIDILTKERLGNVKLRASIVKALSHANVSHNNIDFVVETLFRLSNDRMAAVRKECLLTLQTLSAKSKSQVTYLKPRTILPLFYKFLRDLDVEVKEAALQCIYEAGPHGQLLLVEGLSKDANPQTRAQAARGLGLFGPSTFRSLLLGLHDGSAEVRKSVAKTIVTNFSLEAVLEEFLDKPAQRQGIKCAVKEILTLPFALNQTCANFLRDLLSLLEDEQFETQELSQSQYEEEY